MKVNKMAVCRFFRTCLNDVAEDTIQKLLNSLLLNLDRNIFSEFVTCKPCYNDLVDFLNLINNGLNAEEKIKEYCEAKETNMKGQVQLMEVQHFIPKNEPKCQSDSMNAINIREQYFKQTVKKSYESIKAEVKDDLALTDSVKIEEFECPIKEDNQLKTKWNNRYQGCARSFEHPETEPMGTGVSKVVVPGIYECNICEYNTMQKRNLQRHMFVHRDTSEITMYKCHICAFQSKHKRSLQKHTLNHKDAAEVTMHKCSMCEYQSRHKSILDQHVLRHRNSSEVTMYNCNKCEHQAKRKYDLQKHILTHRNDTEVKTYKCSMCEYRSKQRRHLKSHILLHKNPSKATMYKCNTCEYQTKRKYHIEQHMLTHKDVSEVPMYKCDICEFQTRHKYNLPLHVLKHKNTSEVTMYKCYNCKFQTKYKSYLRRHVFTHKNASK